MTSPTLSHPSPHLESPCAVAMAALLADSTPTALVADFVPRPRAQQHVPCLDTALRHDITRPDVLNAAATSFFVSMALQHHPHHLICGNFTPAMLAAAHLTTTSRAFLPGFTPRLTPERARLVPATPCARVHALVLFGAAASHTGGPE